ncbi:hypothetical protein HBI09_032760 [Parastagonospora nodorum]|nr:hypothetical protein HBI09_032760 [Parastagonospora nodorum]KAH4201458.1 hypothetical protein HBH42_029700 [Parastagonospora nodorum]KAH4998672.1 hypothetical protein HBI77_183800 [Parastagonospora nodorum]
MAGGPKTLPPRQVMVRTTDISAASLRLVETHAGTDALANEDKGLICGRCRSVRRCATVHQRALHMPAGSQSSNQADKHWRHLEDICARFTSSRPMAFLSHLSDR